MLKTLLIGIAALLATGIALLMILASLKPDTFQVQRSIAIAAPPERIYPLIADLRAWSAWSPWEKKDPAMTRSYSGAPSGVGARYAWRGNGDVGEGEMEIVEAAAPRRVGIDLDFRKPFAARNKSVFALEPQGSGTLVTWTMTGPTPFVAKVVHVVINMDRMVGGEFEAGLQAMKAEAERPSA